MVTERLEAESDLRLLAAAPTGESVELDVDKVYFVYLIKREEAGLTYTLQAFQTGSVH